MPAQTSLNTGAVERVLTQQERTGLSQVVGQIRHFSILIYDYLATRPRALISMGI